MESVIPKQSNRVTEQEYLRMEEVAETKHEFREGEIIDMAGGTADHAALAANLIRWIGNRLEGKPCRAYGSDLRVQINKSRNYVYPDVSIVCGPLEFSIPDRRTTISNPRVVIEVTSKSTEIDDRGDKFTDYRRIESLAEYFLVSQERALIDAYYRQPDGIWAIGPSVTDLKQSMKFRSIGIEVLLKDIYAGIEFPPARTKTESE